MPPTLAELIDSNRRLADSNFATAAAIQKLIPSFEQLRRDIYDIKNDRETDNAHIELALGKIETSLALLQEMSRRLPGDVTGAFKIAQAEERKTAAERFFDRLERANTSTKMWVLVFIIVAIASGWASHLFEH